MGADDQASTDELVPLVYGDDGLPTELESSCGSAQGGCVRRKVVAVMVALIGATGCQYANSIAPEATPETLRMHAAQDFTWNGFRVQLDPTVMVWADETSID